MSAILEPSLCKCCNEHSMDLVCDGVWACRKCDMFEEMLVPVPEEGDQP